jgi:hypothetical protein
MKYCMIHRASEMEEAQTPVAGLEWTKTTEAARMLPKFVDIHT